MIEILLGADRQADLGSALERVRRARRLPPFGATQIDFAAVLSKRLLSDPETRAFPDLVAFGYWIRPARLEELKQKYERILDGDLGVARGLVLHYAPSNVDTIFAYSFVLALLTGNANVVRLSRRRERPAEILLAHVGRALDEPAFAQLRERTLVLSSDHDPEVNRTLSLACDLRVIWGGDETIRTIREAPLAPSATDLVFPDRFSLALLDAGAILALDEAAWERFLHDFENDVFTYGQMACSSPRLIGWVGAAADRERARVRFWERFLSRAKGRDERDWSQPVSARLTAACRLALLDDAGPAHLDFSPPVTRLEVARLTPEMREIHPGGGFFLERGFDALADAAADVAAKDQTLVCWGFERETLRAFAASLPAGGSDRVVPVGQALLFSHVWDGQDLLQAFTRRVAISV